MRIGVAVLCLLFSTLAFAQQSDYPGDQVKALLPEQIEQLLHGSGMGLAKAAELNHYPGPRHVLAMAQQLNLSAQQTEKTKIIFDHMQAEAITLGRRIVEQERELDRLFQSQEITPSRLDHLVQRIATLNGQLRAVHLQAHLAEREVLTHEQLGRYDELRGYAELRQRHHPQ